MTVSTTILHGAVGVSSSSEGVTQQSKGASFEHRVYFVSDSGTLDGDTGTRLCQFDAKATRRCRNLLFEGACGSLRCQSRMPTFDLITVRVASCFRR